METSNPYIISNMQHQKFLWEKINKALKQLQSFLLPILLKKSKMANAINICVQSLI